MELGETFWLPFKYIWQSLAHYLLLHNWRHSRLGSIVWVFLFHLEDWLVFNFGAQVCVSNSSMSLPTVSHSAFFVDMGLGEMERRGTDTGSPSSASCWARIRGGIYTIKTHRVSHTYWVAPKTSPYFLSLSFLQIESSLRSGILPEFCTVVYWDKHWIFSQLGLDSQPTSTPYKPVTWVSTYLLHRVVVSTLWDVCKNLAQSRALISLIFLLLIGS